MYFSFFNILSWWYVWSIVFEWHAVFRWTNWIKIILRYIRNDPIQRHDSAWDGLQPLKWSRCCKADIFLLSASNEPKFGILKGKTQVTSFFFKHGNKSWFLQCSVWETPKFPPNHVSKRPNTCIILLTILHSSDYTSRLCKPLRFLPK